MDSILQSIQQLVKAADETGRMNIIHALRNLSFELEDEDDTVHRVGYMPLQSATVRTAIDLKLFELLCERQNPVTLAEIAKGTGADIVLLGRLTRFLACHGYIKEVAQDTFTSNSITKTLAIPGNQAGLCHMFDTCTPLYTDMPAFLKKNNWQNATDSNHTVFQDAFKTEQGPFQWFTEHAENLKFFNDYMAYRRQGEETWLSVYPVEEETKGWNAADPVYVNIGGSIGHQCAQFKAKYPSVPGRVILQDLPHTVEKALQTPGVENMAHDFFQPQPILSAKFYYLRGVLHDHPDPVAKTVLENTKAAMGKNSVILVDEMVLPDAGNHARVATVAAIDLTMMCAMGSRERTESQWKELFHSAGLKVVKSLTYKPAACETVMALVPII